MRWGEVIIEECDCGPHAICRIRKRTLPLRTMIRWAIFRGRIILRTGSNYSTADTRSQKSHLEQSVCEVIRPRHFANLSMWVIGSEPEIIPWIV